MVICYFFDNISDSAGLQTSSVVYCVLPKAKEVTHMAKITIEELFYGDKYGIMGKVVKQVFVRQDEFVADPHTFRELEIVRQTLIAVEKMKKNSDCIAEGELGDAVTVSVCGGSDENN